MHDESKYLNNQIISLRKKKECIKRKEELGRAKNRQSALGELAESENQEIRKLEKRIFDFESSRLSQKASYEGTVGERDMFATQLVRRNDELALLYEKLKIQYSTLQEGEISFKGLENELRSLRIDYKGAVREYERSKQSGNSVEDTKRMIFSTQRELLQERTKVKALSEELENPRNLQRWRKLGGQDPGMYEMVQKVLIGLVSLKTLMIILRWIRACFDASK